jgi:transcriptional regulator with XRE-family HTH domain
MSRGWWSRRLPSFSSLCSCETLLDRRLKKSPISPMSFYIFFSFVPAFYRLNRSQRVSFPNSCQRGRFLLLLCASHSATLQANMPPKRFDNYIRMFRKQRGLSQDELAFLLGWKSGFGVSRFERGEREPSLETLLAMEAIFGIPIRELYAGRFQKVEASVKERARYFVSSIGEDLSRRKRLRDLLSAIYSRETSLPS